MYTVNFVDEHDALVWGRPPLCVCVVELDRALLQTRCVLFLLRTRIGCTSPPGRR